MGRLYKGNAMIGTLTIIMLIAMLLINVKDVHARCRDLNEVHVSKEYDPVSFEKSIESIDSRKDCRFPSFEKVNHYLDMYYGDSTYVQELVKGRKNEFTLIMNITGRYNLLDPRNILEIVAFATIRCGNNPFNLSRVYAGISLSPDSTILSNGNYELRYRDCFSIPDEATSCEATVNILGRNQTYCANNNITSNCFCIIPGLENSMDTGFKETLTIDEYISKLQAEIARHEVENLQRQIERMDIQTNISKRQTEIMNTQANISQQQTEIMRENQKLEKERQIFGFDKGAILVFLAGIFGTLLGFILSDIGNYQNRKEGDIENIYEPLSDELERLKEHISKEEPIDVFLKAVKHRREYDNRYLKDENYRIPGEPPIKPGEYDLPQKPTEWNIILHKNLSIWIPSNLRNELFEFYKNDKLFEEYNGTISKTENEDRDKTEKRNMVTKDISDKISHLQKLLKDEMRIGWRYYLKDKFREVLEFIKK